MLMVALVTVLAKKTLADIQAIDFIWLQMVFACVSICIYSFWIKREKITANIPLAAWAIILAIGISNLTIVRTLFILALEVMPVTTHAYLINFVGIMTMILSAIFLRERPGFWQVVGALVAIAGIQIYFRVIPDNQLIYGLVLIALAVFFLALTNILMRLLHLKYPNFLSHNVVSSVAVVSGGLPLILYGLQYWERALTISFNHWIVIAANGVIAMSLTMNVFNLVLKVLRAYQASILASSGLVFTAMFAIPILDESLNLFQLGGIALLLLGIAMVQCFRNAQ